MNAALFRSWHALGATVVTGAFTLWLVLGTDARTNRTFALTSGWVALALFFVVIAYVLRKYVHKLGISPEFRMKVPIAQLERAEARLSELRARVASGPREERSDVQRDAKAILRDEGVQRVVRVVVEPTESGYEVNARPTQPLGAMAYWMRSHLYYGLAAGVLVGLHGSLSTGSTLALLLNGFTLLVVVSGLVGGVFWCFGPSWLTRAEGDLSIERAHALRESLERKIESSTDRLDEATRKVIDNVRARPAEFSERSAAALSALPVDATDRAEAQDVLALLGQLHGVRRELRRLMHIQRAMHAWRVVHIPGTLLLLAVVAIHVVSVLWCSA